MNQSPKTFPSFELSSLKGIKVTEKDLSDKITFIRFSTTFCSICKSENPVINMLFEEMGEKLNWLDINIGEDQQKVKEHVSEQAIKYTALLDSDSSLTAKLGILGTPTHFLLKKGGEICFRGTGALTEDQLRELIANCK